MSLILTQSTPVLCAKTLPIGGEDLSLGNYTIPLADFVELVMYVMTNTDLRGEDDPRRQLVQEIKAMKEGPGFNRGETRFCREVTTSDAAN